MMSFEIKRHNITRVISWCRIGAWPWITFRSVPLYLIPEGFHVCWHSRQGALRWSCVGKWQFPFFLLHIGHCLLIAARFIFQASWPFVLSCVVLSTSKASSMALRAWILGSKMSGLASYFLLAASVFARSDRLSDPVPYIAPVANDFGMEMRSPLQNSDSWTTSSSLLPSLTVHTYIDRSSAKAAWFHWGIPLMPWVMPVASSKRRRALMNRLKRRGDSTDPCTVSVSSCMGAVHSDPTCIFIMIHELLYRASRNSTSGTPSPLRIAQRQECPAELKAFLKSRSTRIRVPLSFIACYCTQWALCTTICTPQCARNPYWEPSMTAYFSESWWLLLLSLLEK